MLAGDLRSAIPSALRGSHSGVFAGTVWGSFWVSRAARGGGGLSVEGEIKYPSPSPSKGHDKALLREGVSILKPPATGILYPPLFHTHPTPTRVFLRRGGVGVHRNLPPILFPGFSVFFF